MIALGNTVSISRNLFREMRASGSAAAITQSPNPAISEAVKANRDGLLGIGIVESDNFAVPQRHRSA
jgi:hypothetical protein